MEIFDICDEEGRPTGETVSRQEAHEKGILHRTVHIWLVKREGEEVFVLLQKRARNKDSFPGCWDTSSAGHIMAGDAPLESALRELEEELGLSAAPEDLRFGGTLHVRFEEVFHGSLFRENEIIFLYWLERDVPEEEIRIQEEELEDAVWFSYEEVKAAIERRDPAFCAAPESLAVLGRALGLPE